MRARRSKFAKRLQVAGYDIEGRLEAASEVYAATKASTGRKVVIKLPSIASDGSRDFDVFYREVKVLAALDHPSIVSIIDAGETSSGLPFFVRPFITGQTLEAFAFPTNPKVRPDIRTQLLVFCKVTAALDELHRRGIVHRNLKPVNVLVDQRGEPHVLDFGIAFLPKEKHYEGKGTGMGSPLWMSPEHLRGDWRTFDTRSDIFSLGAILYHLLTDGHYPFEKFERHTSALFRESPIPFRTWSSRGLQTRLRRAGIGEPDLTGKALEAITLKALAKNPTERYQSVLELAHEIHDLIDPARSPKGHHVIDDVANLPANIMSPGRTLRNPMRWPGLGSIKAVYNRLPALSAKPDWDRLPGEQQYWIAQMMIDAALNAPKAADEITRSFVVDPKIVAEFRKIPTLLTDMMALLGSSPLMSSPPAKPALSETIEEDELMRTWHRLNPVQRAIVKFMRKKSDNVLNYNGIADNIVMPRLSGEVGRKADGQRDMSDKTIRNHCLPMFETPLLLIQRVGQRGGIHLTEKGTLLAELAAKKQFS